MIILIHVIIALSSLIMSGYTYLFPSKKTLSFSYAFILSTIASGTYLLLTTPTHLVQSCLMGLFYLGIVSTATLAAHRKLAKAQAEE